MGTSGRDGCRTGQGDSRIGDKDHGADDTALGAAGDLRGGKRIVSGVEAEQEDARAETHVDADDAEAERDRCDEGREHVVAEEPRPDVAHGVLDDEADEGWVREDGRGGSD